MNKKKDSCSLGACILLGETDNKQTLNQNYEFTVEYVSLQSLCLGLCLKLLLLEVFSLPLLPPTSLLVFF